MTHPRLDSPSPDSSKRITLGELRALRMRTQCLAPRQPREALIDIVKAVCGVNAQLFSAMALSLRARAEGLTIDDIEACRVKDRTLVRTWCMRGTMHLLAADDVDWMLSAIAPAEIRGGWRWLERRGGMKRARAAQVLDEAYKTLKANGAMTRPDLMAALAKRFGERVKPAAAGVVQFNGILGRVCFGPDQGAKPTYAALDSWLGRQVKITEKPDDVRLARRFLQGYGPAEPRDLAAWWGLGFTQAKAAWAQLEQELIEFDVGGQSVWMLALQASALAKTDNTRPTVRLLPAFDTYLLGYDSRDFAVPPEYQERVFHGGEIVPTILVDGCAAGTWRYEQRGKQIRIRVTPFSSFTSRIRDLIAEEVDDIARFFGLASALSFVKAS